MSYAVKAGTIEAFWIDNDVPPVGHVRFDGTLTNSLIWGDDIQNLREPNASEVLAAAKVSRKASINAEAQSRILAVYPLEKQSSASLGIYPAEYRATMTEDIASVIAASNTACDSVDAATTVAGVDAVVVSWPSIGA